MDYIKLVQKRNTKTSTKNTKIKHTKCSHKRTKRWSVRSKFQWLWWNIIGKSHSNKWQIDKY